MRKNPRAYYHYGEGSIHHTKDGSRPCKYGLPGNNHPTIQRTEWPSKWHYRWSRLAGRVWERFFTGHIRILDNETFTFGRVGGWLFNQAHPDRPRLLIEFDPKDSIYND